MYKLSVLDAATLGQEIIHMSEQVQEEQTAMTLVYSEKMGTTFVMNSDKTNGHDGLDVVIEVIP